MPRSWTSDPGTQRHGVPEVDERAPRRSSTPGEDQHHDDQDDQDEGGHPKHGEDCPFQCLLLLGRDVHPAWVTQLQTTGLLQETHRLRNALLTPVHDPQVVMR